MKNSNGFAAVLWDMDGVLIDSEPLYNETVRDLMRTFGREYGPAEIAKVTGLSYKDFASVMELDIPTERYISALADGARQVTELVPGVMDLLRALNASGRKMALGSSSPREIVSLIVDKFGLSAYLGAVVTGSDNLPGKPSPDIYLKCSELLDVPASGCLVIEDSINGVKAGKAAGMTVCAFTGTKIHDFDLSAADFSVASFTALKNLLFC